MRRLAAMTALLLLLLAPIALRSALGRPGMADLDPGVAAVRGEAALNGNSILPANSSEDPFFGWAGLDRHVVPWKATDEVAKELRAYPNASAVFAVRINDEANAEVQTNGLVITIVCAHSGPPKDMADMLQDLNITLHTVLPWDPWGPDNHTIKFHLCGNDPLPPGHENRWACAFNEIQFEKGEAELFEAYRDWPPFLDADVFVCAFDPVFCSILKAFNKPMIIMSAFRIDGHLIHKDRRRIAPAAARHVQERLLQLSHHPKVVFSCTNLYDCFYQQHFLGTRRIVPLLAVSRYAAREALSNINCSTYGIYSPPNDAPFLFAPKKLRPTAETVIHHLGTVEIPTALLKRAQSVLPVPYHQMCDLGRLARGYVLLPYSVHSYFIVELAAMGLPLFAPSLRLLRQLELRYHILTERTIDSEQRMTGSFMTVSPRSFSKGFDPNNDLDSVSLSYWLQFCDWYSYGEAARFFDSGASLLALLANASASSLRDMQVHALGLAKKRENVWKRNLVHALRLLNVGVSREWRFTLSRNASLSEALAIWNRGVALDTWGHSGQQGCTSQLTDNGWPKGGEWEVDTKGTVMAASNWTTATGNILAGVLLASCHDAQWITLGPVRGRVWALPFLSKDWARAWAMRLEFEMIHGADPKLDAVPDVDLRRFVRSWSRAVPDRSRTSQLGFFNQAMELCRDLETAGLAPVGSPAELKRWLVMIVEKGGAIEPSLAPQSRWSPDSVLPQNLQHFE